MSKAFDISLSCTISFLDSLKGVSKTFSYTKETNCPKCHGTQMQPGTQKVICTKCLGERFFILDYKKGKIMNCDTCKGEGKIIEHFCTFCTGKGRIKSSGEVTIDLPGGITNGAIIRVPMAGNVSKENISDLLINVKVEESFGLPFEIEYPNLRYT